MWAIRLQKLAGISSNLAKVQFTGCGVSLMQQKSALYTLGTEIVCKTTAHNTHQVHTVNQYCKTVMIPETLESPGMYMPNLYMKDVRGGDVHINTGGPFDMVVADAFNGFCPKSNSASGYCRPCIFTTGRLERLNEFITRDLVMRAEAYTCMSTLHASVHSTLLSGLKTGMLTKTMTTRKAITSSSATAFIWWSLSSIPSEIPSGTQWRDLNDSREPVTRVTVQDVCQEYSRTKPATGQAVV
ncbi:hypothetical protein PAMP_011500 [Pampus punctatissimus]